MRPEISIIIVSWNVRELLKKCLQSINANRGDLELEVIVIDNASADNTAEMVRNDFSDIRIIANGKNAGFAAANNQGYEISDGGYVLFLNPDTEILPNALQRSLNFLKSNEKIGIVGCRLLNPDMTTQPSVRRFPTFCAIFLILTKIARLFPDLSALKNYLARDFDYSRASSVDQVAGAFFLTKRSLLEKIGLFDERFFIWFEEVDLCKRMVKAGYEVWYYPLAEIVHHGGQSFKQQLTYKNQKNFIRSAWLYFRKNGLK